MVSLLLVPTFQQEIHHAIIPYYDVMYFPFLKPDLIWMRSKLYVKKFLQLFFPVCIFLPLYGLSVDPL